MPPAIGLVAATVGSFFSAVTGIGAAAGFFGTVLGGTIAKVATSFLLMELTKPSKPKIGNIGTGQQIQFKADTNAGVPLVIGRTATGGNIVHVTTSGQATHNNGLTYIVVLSTGPIGGFEYMIADEARQTFGYNGSPDIVSSGTWAGTMALNIQPGYQPSSWHEVTGIGNQENTWDQNKKLSGLAVAFWYLGYTPKAFPNGVPKPLWILRGPRVYDPRRDSTYGGSGPQRWYDSSTWDWIGNDNPYLQGLTWCIGHYQNGDFFQHSKPVHGAGVSIANIDVQSFIDGANVCDANGWKVGGVVTSADRKWDVLKAMLQAGCGEPLKLAGKISCIVTTPRAALDTINESDIRGKVTITGTKSRRDRINRIVPRYRSEANKWEYVSAAAEFEQTYIDLDGGQRSKEVEYSLVQDAKQAAQLARYDIENSREREPLTIPLGLEWADYKPGDALYLNAPELGLAPVGPVKILILRRDIDLEQGLCILYCRTETDFKHAAALGRTANPPPSNQNLPVYDLSKVYPPSSYAYISQGATLLSPATGQQVPIIRFFGGSENPFAKNVVGRYRLLGTETWAYVESWAGDFLTNKINMDVSSVTAGSQYEMQVAYRDGRGLLSDFTPLSTVTAGQYTPPVATSDLTPSSSVGEVQGVVYTYFTEVVTSGSVDVYATGGTPPYEWQWVQISGDPMEVSDDTGTTVTFSALLSTGTVKSGVWRAVVSDSALIANTNFAEIKVSLYNITPLQQ